MDTLLCPKNAKTEDERMNDETRKQIALQRYKLISPVLAESGRNRNAWFREIAGKEHQFPHYGSRIVAVSTLKSWMKAYRKKGFDGLIPKKRADGGRPRKLGEKEMAAIRGKCKANPRWSVQKLHEDLLANHQLGDKPICYNTLLRIVHREDLLPEAYRTDQRKRFEMPAVNEMWTCDFMHGPRVELPSGRAAKSILCAIIDDHSRVIVGHAFSNKETVSALTVVLKEAFEKHGLPRRLYVDNGSAFSSDLLTLACARTGISLTHSRPYVSPSRGNIERFFRTVRGRFLVNLGQDVTLDEINEAFSLWLKEDYHEKPHKGIDATPMDRYRESVFHAEIRRVTPAELDEAFLTAHERIVNNDATISFKGNIYEVPAAYVRQRVEIRHPVDDPDELCLYDNGARIAKLRLVNANENARVFRPDPAKSQVRFAKSEVF
jgi:transposase InsO family protein